MAHTEIESAYYSGVFTNSEVKSKIFTCEMCKEYDTQLQETRDELKSMIMINKLLQKELLLHTSTENMGTTSLGPNVNKDHPRINAPNKWTQITTTSKKVNRQEHNWRRPHDKVIDTSNRFAQLTKLTDTNDTIQILSYDASLSKNNYKP